EALRRFQEGQHARVDLAGRAVRLQEFAPRGERIGGLLHRSCAKLRRAQSERARLFEIRLSRDPTFDDVRELLGCSRLFIKPLERVVRLTANWSSSDTSPRGDGVDGVSELASVHPRGPQC